MNDHGRVVVGRQCVHDRHLNTVGYELLLSAVDDTEPATLDVLDALSIGWDRLIGDNLAYCSASRAMLASPAPVTLLPAASVIGVDAAWAGDHDVLLGCQRLREQGFRIAVDNVGHSIHSVQPLLDLATTVRLDMHALGDRLADVSAACREFDVDVLVRGIETPAELDTALAAGADLLQGFALQASQQVSGRLAGAGATELGRLRIAARALGQMLDFEEIEDILRTEPGLTYQVLQLASLGRRGELRRRVETLRDALVIAGSWRVQNWITLLTARADGLTVSHEVTTTLARASACETAAARRLDRRAVRMAFTAGMVSCFDRLLQIPRAEIIASVPMTDELQEAAFGERSDLAHIVCDIADHQSGRRFPRRLSGMTMPELDSVSASAFKWAFDATDALVA